MKRTNIHTVSLAILVCLCFSGCLHMNREINTPNVFESRIHGFSQAIESRGSRLLFLSGQVGWDEKGRLVGHEIEDQANQAMKNILAILEKEKGDTRKISCLRFYIVNYDESQLPVIKRLLKNYFPEDYKPATTVVGVDKLARNELLIEIEAIASLTN